GVVMRPLEPERWILFGYVYQARQPLGPNALAFLDCVRRVLERFRAESAENAGSVVLIAQDA
ncbi:MAG: LysR family transcriptional regulator, partial [Burkholderiales bacterium]|nr:LysR family transcriptional regulator [Burkholderiales bacterium]